MTKVPAHSFGILTEVLKDLAEEKHNLSYFMKLHKEKKNLPKTTEGLLFLNHLSNSSESKHM